MNTSGVSPERWLTIVAYPPACASLMAVSVSVTVPIWLSLIKHGVADLLGHGAADDRRVGDEHVVADQLHAAPQLARDRFPAFPIVFGQRIFDRPEGIIVEPAGEQSESFRRSSFLRRLTCGICIRRLVE